MHCKLGGTLRNNSANMQTRIFELRDWRRLHPKLHECMHDTILHSTFSNPIEKSAPGRTAFRSAMRAGSNLRRTISARHRPDGSHVRFVGCGRFAGRAHLWAGYAFLRHCRRRTVDFWRRRRICRQPQNPSRRLQSLGFSNGGSHNSIRFPSGSIIQAKRPYSSFCCRRSISTPASSSWRSSPSRSSTR